jgi:hypothetical protein
MKPIVESGGNDLFQALLTRIEVFRDGAEIFQSVVQ